LSFVNAHYLPLNQYKFALRKITLQVSNIWVWIGSHLGCFRTTNGKYGRYVAWFAMAFCFSVHTCNITTLTTLNVNHVFLANLELLGRILVSVSSERIYGIVALQLPLKKLYL